MSGPSSALGRGVRLAAAVLLLAALVGCDRAAWPATEGPADTVSVDPPAVSR